MCIKNIFYLYIYSLFMNKFWGFLFIKLVLFFYHILYKHRMHLLLEFH